MKTIELKQVPKNRQGGFHKNGIRLEPHEERTAEFLTLYGFNIEVIRPMNTPEVHNPDILMSGTIWEMKAPESSNLKTIKKRIHETSEQPNHLVLDLRKTRKDYEKVERDAIRRFQTNADLRRMILITNEKKILDFKK
ncbi:hypothetical protein IJH23_02380 [Candidatus Saccharibacteria bacterium]|nr:hypothetical protein [Candidatus Saccharibacteria bacterium]